MKFFSTKVLWILAAGFVFTCLVRADDDVLTIVSKLQKRYDAIRDVSVVFTQNVRFGVTKSEQTFNGKLFMKRGNKYRIELEQQTIVTDGNSVWSYTKGNNQVLIDNYKDDLKSFSPDKILVNVPNNYYSTLLGKERLGSRETSILKLVPKDDKSNLKWMKVWVDQDEWLMRKIQVLDVSDNLTTYLIEKIKLNSGLVDSLFQFEIPTDVEVIDLR
jgi:outer membrane lipoprotein carrier protein